jgi:hypothetical protein
MWPEICWSEYYCEHKMELFLSTFLTDTVNSVTLQYAPFASSHPQIIGSNRFFFCSTQCRHDASASPACASSLRWRAARLGGRSTARRTEGYSPAHHANPEVSPSTTLSGVLLLVFLPKGVSRNRIFL